MAKHQSNNQYKQPPAAAAPAPVVAAPEDKQPVDGEQTEKIELNEGVGEQLNDGQSGGTENHESESIDNNVAGDGEQLNDTDTGISEDNQQPDDGTETTSDDPVDGAEQPARDQTEVFTAVDEVTAAAAAVVAATIPQVFFTPPASFPQTNQEQYSVDEQQLIEFFQDYAVKMAKGRPVSPTDIATNQVGWFRKVMILLDLEPKAFRRVMDFLMANIVEHLEGAYHPARRMRGMTAQLRLTDRERVQFQMLMQVFCDMADPAGRDAMRNQTSAEKALGNGLSETARARLGEYFRLG